MGYVEIIYTFVRKHGYFSRMETRKYGNMEDIINWRALSRLLKEDGDTVRSNRIPKRHKIKMQELKDLIEYWKKRNGID